MVTAICLIAICKEIRGLRAALCLVLVCPGSQATSGSSPGNGHTWHPQALKQAQAAFQTRCGDPSPPPPAPGCLQQQDQRRAWQSPTVDVILGQLGSLCPSPPDNTRKRRGGCGGLETQEENESVWRVGREREPRQVATSHGSEENERTLHQQFSRHQLVVEGKEAGCPRKTAWSWRGGPHVVRVSGGLDLDGGLYSLSMTKAPRPRQARAGRVEGPG